MKRLNWALLFTLLLVLITSLAYGAGACTTTSAESQTVRVIQMDWLSDASGDVSGEGSVSGVSGTILGVVFEPDSGGTQPTNLYDITVVDAGGADVLHGVGANLTNDPTSTLKYKTPYSLNDGFIVLYNETLEPVVSNAGNAKGGIIKIMLDVLHVK